MRKSTLLVLVLVAAVAALLSIAAGPSGAAQARKLGEGDGVFRPVQLGALPGTPLPDTLEAAQRVYLGLGPASAAATFTLGDVRGDLVVVEFFNASCYACALMAPVMDDAWRRVAARPELAARVRFLGVGVGNTAAQVREFHARYDTPFPMVADPEFAAFDALGAVEGTPYLVLLRRRADGVVAAQAQVGYIPDAGRVVIEIEAALGDVPTAGAEPREQRGTGWRTLRPPLPPQELEARLAAAAAAAGLGGATVAEVPLPGGELFYRLAAGERVLWALVAGRSKVCNVCHDVFFIVVFDGEGRVVELAPLSMTKYKNVEFDERDVAFLRGRVVGRLLTPGIVFDPAVDAVSTATMTSALVFDTLRRLGDAWKAMVAAGSAPR
jgi:peroxiredoxin